MHSWPDAPSRTIPPAPPPPPSTIPRLLDLGVEDYLVSSTLRAVVAQRLVSRICRNCQEEYEVNVNELARYDLDEWGLEHSKMQRGKGCGFWEGYGH